MWIKRIALANWCAYDEAVFDMPRRDARSNVVIIGAKNGVGKTNLLRAITLCLFGEQGFTNFVRVGGATPRSTYSEFLRSTLYHHADDTLSSPKSSVSLTIEVDNDTEVLVERIWHFKVNREFSEEELRIHENGKPIHIPVLAEERDRNAIRAGYITDKFLPPSLSPFFLFDGGQVQQMAQRDMRKQVQNGVEGILGIPVVRRLILNLKDYARIRRTDGMTGRATDSKMELLQQDINRADAEIKQLAEKLQDLDERLKQKRGEQDKLFSKFQEMGGDDVAKVGMLREKSAKLEKEGEILLNNLADFLTGDFAMSLAGASILTVTADRIQAEIKRVDWERSKKSGAEKYDKFIMNLEQLDALSLPLPKEQTVRLRENLKAAWDDVWYPMPDECAKDFLNPGFSDGDRVAATVRLTRLSKISIVEITNLRENITRNQTEKSVVDRQIANVSEDHGEDIQQLHKQIKENQEEIVQMEKKKGTYEREKKDVEEQRFHSNEEMSRQISQRKDKDPFLHCSVQAENAVRMIEEIIDNAYSHHVVSIAQEMTSAYMSMAHKGVVSNIQIDNQCDVKLLTKEGKNIRELDPSHGESQIFALALIAAIARVSKNLFPFIIDTPLANLDQRHRQTFLRYFSSDMDNQILFLSTDEEIRNEHRPLIRHRIAHKFLVEQEQNGGVGRNIVRPGQYFWEDEE